MKKTIAVLLTGAICAASLAGCGDKTTESSQASSVSQTSEVSSESTSEVSETKEESTEASSTAETSETSKTFVPTLEYIDGEWEIDDCLTLADYKGMDLTKEITTITDKHIQDYYASAIQPVEVTDADAVVENGDTLETTYQFAIDDADYNEASDYTFRVGSNSNISGFEEGMIGHKAGDEVYLDLKFPHDYWDESVAGKDAKFHVVIKTIKRTEEPTDEWVKESTNGDYTTVADFEVYLRDYLEKRAEANTKANLRSSAWTALTEKAEFIKLPQSYIDEGRETVEKQFNSNMASYGYTDLDQFLEATGQSKSDYEYYVASNAESYAKSLLIVNAIWEKEGLNDDSEVYVSVLQEIAAANATTVDDLFTLYDETQIKGYAKNLAVDDVIIGYANVTEVEAKE